MSRSSQNGVGIALGAVAALSVGSALLQKRGSRHTYGVPAEEKGKWTYLYAQRFFTNVKNPERGKPVGNYYRRMFAGPGYGTQKGPEYFSIYDHGVERVRIRKGGLWDIFPPTSTSSWGDNYAINRYTPAYVRRIQGVDFIATQGVPPKVPDRWNYTPGAGYRRIAGYKNPNVVEIPFMSTTTVDVHGAVVYQLAHHDPPSRVQRARISKALNELIRRGVDNNTELLEGDLLSASSVRDVYRFREIDFSDTWLEVYNLEGNRIQGGEFVAKSTPPVLCPQCDGDENGWKGAHGITEEQAGVFLKELAWDGAFSASTIRMVLCSSYYWPLVRGETVMPEDEEGPLWGDAPQVKSWYRNRGRAWERKAHHRRLLRTQRSAGLVTKKDWADACKTMNKTFADDLRRFAAWTKMASWYPGEPLEQNPSHHYRKSVPGTVSAERSMGPDWARKNGLWPPFSRHSNWGPYSMQDLFKRFVVSNRGALQSYMWKRGVPTPSIRMLRSKR
jgi:hypothetical protein